MRNKDFDKLLKEAIILEAEEQGARMEPCAESIPETAQARFDAALNGTPKEPKQTITDKLQEKPQPVKHTHRWLTYGLTAGSAVAVVLVVVLLVGIGGIRGTKAPEPADIQPPQAETTLGPVPQEPTAPEPVAPTEPEPGELTEPEPEPEWPESIVDTWVIWEKIEASDKTIEMDGRFDEMSLVFDVNGKLTVTVYDQIEIVDYTVTGDTVAFTISGESVLGQHDPYDSLTVKVPSTGETLVFERESWAERLFEVSSNTYTADNGLSGIGNIRGNTNGNLQYGGRAVSDGKRIFYIDQTVDHLRICRYTLATGETTVLAERTDVDKRSAGYLNYSSGVPNIIGPELYFVIDDAKNDSDIMCLSLTDGSMKKIASDQNICGFFDVYGFLYYVTGNSTKELAANGLELGEIEDFRMIGAMGGLLYGMRGDRIAAISWNSHELVQSYDLKGDVYVSCGYLIGCEISADETTVLTVVNVETGETKTIPTALKNASVENIGMRGIYLKKNGYLSVGSIWRLDWEGTGPECVDSRLYELGPTLWYDSFLSDFVPCDEMAGKTDAVPADDLAEVNTVVYQWQGYNCLLPEGFVSVYESDHEFLARTEQMNDQDLFLMDYSLHPETDLSGWDSDVFSDNHLKTLLGTIGAQADYADFTGVSSRTITDGIVCYHLYNESQKVYACLAKVMSDGENCLVMAGMTMGEPGIDAFDSIVNAFINQSSKKEDDPERPDLHLFAKEWQGYTCLFPETFEIQAVTDQKLSATEEALLKLDMAALQTVGLTDMDYYLVAESMLNGKDLLTWYLEADGWDDKPEDFDTAESVEIAPGIVSVHYYNRVYDSYICIAKLNTIGTNTLFLAASSITKAGTADFDGIAKEFLAMNGDFAPNETGILNGKYGKSKVFAGDGYQITLTEQFSEQKSEMGFDGYYTAYFSAVMIKIEPFTLKKGWENETVAEYIADVIKNNGTDVKPEEKDGLVFYRYQRDGMCGWNFAFKGEKAFYLVQFLCREADASELEELFFSIAKTIKVEGSERWNT